ncbi:MAG TPA: hypothetical protein VIA06_20640 [Candidatus Dormibacteraeota bacterium]|jgi:hypothetical protein|nr:hypothetical protein [Candidatus Dormibacteraeota bacterium]
MNEVLQSVKSATPVQKVLIGVGAALVGLILLANLGRLVGLVLGIAGAVVALAFFLLPLAIVAAAIYGAYYFFSHRR